MCSEGLRIAFSSILLYELKRAASAIIIAGTRLTYLDHLEKFLR